MYTCEEERQLLIRAQKGDKTASTCLLQAYQGLIRSMSRRYQYTPTGREIADDALGILHLAFMEAIAAYDTDGPVHFAAFLKSRLHSALYAAFRRTCSYNQRTAHPAASEEDGCDWYETVASTEPSPEHRLLARETLQRICQQLSAAEKQLLSLIYVQGMAQTKIARLLHLSPGTISKQKQRLLARLQVIDDMAVGCPCT